MTANNNNDKAMKTTLAGKRINILTSPSFGGDLGETRSFEASLLIHPLERKEVSLLDHEVELIHRYAPHRPFVMAAFEIDDWHLELTPWHDDAISRKPEVGHHADDTLRWVTGELLPELHHRYGPLPAILGGYSLAGLFALWASSLSNVFTAVAAASPSVWISGWREWAEAHPTMAHDVYLSLGTKEEHVRNQSMARVGDNIRFEHDLLQRQLGDDHVTLEWNPGGHFVDGDIRAARAFAWTLK